MADQKITALTAHTAPIDTDVLPIVDITAGATKKVTWAVIKSTLKTYFDTLYGGPTVTITATGTLANGDKVILNSDGTVSVAAGVAASNGSATAVSGSVRNGSSHAAYDSVSGKVVVAYQIDAGNTGLGKCVVGTVSGTSISFGTEAQFNGSFTNTIRVCYTGIGSSKVLIVFKNYNSSQRGEIIVGTISGTTISFGSAVVIEAATAANDISIDWDTGNSKGLLVWNSANSAIKSSVVTVSGTVPTVNTAVTVASVNGAKVRSKWSNASNVFLVCYADSTNSTGRGVVGTVSGTSVSYGTIVTFKAAAISNGLSICWDSTNSKGHIVYILNSDTSGRACVATISGTSVSFGAETTWATGSISSPSTAFDSTNGKVQIGFYDGTNAKAVEGAISGTTVSYGSSQTTTASASVYEDSICYVGSSKFVHLINSGGTTGQVVGSWYTNVTQTNYIGVCTAAYTNGQSAVIAVLGSTNSAQSGMTIGAKYYLADDGTLTTTSTQPYIGIALSATKILLKG